jgi:high-affinity nickel-transport protein
METMPHGWLNLSLVVFMFGLKHGMDADHLATIDGFTRFNAQRRPNLARWSGCLFSAGHGTVVTLVAAMLALTANSWAAPAWLKGLGAWTSIAILMVLGLANLRAVLHAAPGQVMRPVGLTGRLFHRFTESSHPLVVASVGAALAVSFDTMSLTALFAIAASDIAGWAFALGLGLVFTFGMICSDGLNGMWVARMLRRSRNGPQSAYAVMGVTIALLSMATAAVGIARYFSPAFSAALNDAGLLMGVGLLAILFGSYRLAMHLPRYVRGYH